MKVTTSTREGPGHGSGDLINHGLRAMVALLILLAVLGAFRGKAYATRIGAPDPGERTIWALVPHALVIVGVVFLARSRLDLLLLLTSSLVIWLTSDITEHDELGLVFMIVPLLQVFLVVLALSIIQARRLWPKLRKKFTGWRARG